MVGAITGVLGAFAVWFAIIFGKDLVQNKENFEDNSWIKVSTIGFLTNFFDTLGIGSFAPTTALLRGFKQVKDRVIPGTLNVSCSLPVIAEAFIFITVINVDIVTLIAMLAAATIGAWVGAGVVSKLPEKKVQLIMGIALLITAFLMAAGEFGWMPGGGVALNETFEGVRDNLVYRNMEVDGQMVGVPVGVSGTKLVIAIIVNFVLGALMTAGIGLYAPCMALVYLLGMSPRVAFPIMMGSCAFLMPVASVKFIKEGAYNRKAALGITLGGLVGVFIAAYIVKSLPLQILTYLVILVVLYTSITMFRSAFKNQDENYIPEYED
ncbi:sulfite exporter TauE/SafE family protein [Clostridium sp. D2Q-14]|uniref:sulfite exporter TauE/SafE family protein n=1 Tax=Anaeromonas gelatinilytica TaxID=2683194 RepID=UPI00193C3799|nr:sulfite exporter TauE/SafE family protein [Anaeromonas gelatinilytica]MBS4536329.1 sulfite exporter TauE/SafE family protein [Anaeromonas gelatinilytica]